MASADVLMETGLASSLKMADMELARLLETETPDLEEEDDD